MYCTNCGKQIDAESLYCRHCGAQVVDSVSEPPEQPSKNTGSVDAYFENKQDVLLLEAKKAGASAMWEGVAWFFVGLVITAITYAFASPGGTYYIFYGAVLFGVYKLLRGFYYWLFPKQLLKTVEKQMAENESNK